MNHYIKKILVLFLFLFISPRSFCEPDINNLFPIEHYDQRISDWIKPDDPNYDVALLKKEIQNQRYNKFLQHYVGTYSPWDHNYITNFFQQKGDDSLKAMEENIISNFSNEGKPPEEIAYGENFRPYDKDWYARIVNNINLDQFTTLYYQASNRAITVDNLSVRALPTNEVIFYDRHIAGQGYPFDLLQVSAVWAGTPVYIIGESKDHAWICVITPHCIGWVKSTGIAKTSQEFIKRFTERAQEKLGAITETQTSLIDEDNNFLFYAYVGSVFPAELGLKDLILWVPVADAEHQAIIKKAHVSFEKATVMPLTITPHHISRIMQTLIGRPYGWGNMYFYNDCSAELKNLFTPFGIWLPRHSSNQVSEGKVTDLSQFSMSERINYLLQYAKPFLTLIYIPGHVFTYIGNAANPQTNTLVPMTYQNLWGLRRASGNYRAIIGKSVIFPLLSHYPEDDTLQSHAGKNIFQVVDLSQTPEKSEIDFKNLFNLKLLMFPEILLLS